MSDKKVIPITGKHTTFHSLAAEAMATPEAKRGFIVFFDDEGTMSFGECGTTTADTGMALMFLQMVANDIMREPG
jgi:hypothetical protein